MDSVYQNAEIDEPVYGNIENGVPKVNITPKSKPVTSHEKFETRTTQRRNRNPRNPIVSHNPDDIYSLDSHNQPGYHGPSSPKDNSSENKRWCTKRNILISVVLTCLVIVVVVLALVAIPKNAPGKQHYVYVLVTYFYLKRYKTNFNISLLYFKLFRDFDIGISGYKLRNNEEFKGGHNTIRYRQTKWSTATTTTTSSSHTSTSTSSNRTRHLTTSTSKKTRHFTTPTSENRFRFVKPSGVW